jgi:NAD(P)-dependent dehydrogenase (short-subunit alcohol dehydrogenase family)
MNIVITGASSGIGYATTLKFSEDAANTIFALARNREKLEQLVAEATSAGYKGRIVPVAFDIATGDPSSLDEFFKNVQNIDILINNAGLLIKKSFVDLTDTDWMKMIQVNLLGHIKIIRKFAPFMGKTHRGHIVNISSMGGIQGSVKFEGMSAYSATKAAIANLTESMAVEFDRKNISVNCLAPGSVDTEMFRTTFPGYKAAITPTEVADFIVGFCLKGHLYFNGKVLPMATSTP